MYDPDKLNIDQNPEYILSGPCKGCGKIFRHVRKHLSKKPNCLEVYDVKTLDNASKERSRLVQKNYKIANKKKIRSYERNYYLDNRDHIIKRAKKYDHMNKDRISKQKKLKII